MRLTRVLFPSKTILMGEKTADQTPSLNPNNIKAWFGSAKPTEPDAICNLLFVDGHVEGTKRSVYTQPMALQASSEDQLRDSQVSWIPYVGARP
jgi:prepilin-type processing-associated H-X9-DG protein